MSAAGAEATTGTELTPFTLLSCTDILASLSSPKGTNLSVADFGFFPHLFLSVLSWEGCLKLSRISRLAQGGRAAPPPHHGAQFVLLLLSL